MKDARGRNRVVVTGLGTVNPVGNNVEEFWQGLIEVQTCGNGLQQKRCPRMPAGGLGIDAAAPDLPAVSG